ncbi:CheR family methyltransferase [Salimicrobium halophilum]|uniref:protein-glutamate O-methyltransferase n=1 Tax=Salimicrobium halophilum TaxID=86666 RepID=A0A1G8Q0A9_9BACI|nr:protein-glutamate O-methyltransferase CheR [Salimicrobium halophilum]SDI98182.1 chemotaxis protein methyltransferase CheR [Salimicrobium halophilum]
MKNDFEAFIESLDRKTGIDLSKYKEAQMKRRLTTLRDKRGFSTFQDYFRALDKEESLLNELLDRMTINVSEFYRNAKRWETLKEKVLPLFRSKNQKIRLWSAACSTGEEPYTLAILLEEAGMKNYEIIATDIDKKALEKAKRGVYPKRALREMPERLCQKHFDQSGDMYEVKQEIKEKVVFKHHNLLLDSYPSSCQLIICRNVLIYFTEETKASIYKGFNHSLVDDGILFVGSTEQIFTPQQYNFSVFDTFFYQKEQG